MDIFELRTTKTEHKTTILKSFELPSYKDIETLAKKSDYCEVTLKDSSEYHITYYKVNVFYDPFIYEITINFFLKNKGVETKKMTFRRDEDGYFLLQTYVKRCKEEFDKKVIEVKLEESDS